MGIIIGSTAMLHSFGESPRTPKDLDVVVPEKRKGREGVEYLLNPVLSFHKNYNTKENGYLGTDDLYTLKMSHVVGWKVNWVKHIYDVVWMKERGCKVKMDLFHELYKYWNTIHEPNKRSNLDMTEKDFFNNALTFPVYHEELHDILMEHPHFKGQGTPTFRKILKGEIEVDEEKFNTLTHEEKCNLVFEEVAVMAIEGRFPKGMYYKHLYDLMLQKFILNHANLWQAIWIAEHHKELLCNIPFDFKTYFEQKLKMKL